jgi:hypothetical protein
MVDYESEVRKEAVDFIEEVMDDVVEALRNGDDYLLDRDVEDRFFECVTDRSYTLSDAAFVIDNSNNVETDSGLWEGKDPQDAIETQAAFTFSNDVHAEVEEIYEDLKSTYDDNYGEVYDDLMERHANDVKADPDDDDYDATDDAEEAAVKFMQEYFEEEYGNSVSVVTDKKEQIFMIERYLTMADNASMWGGYPVGGSYIDSRCGVGFGMPNIHDYVEYDHKIARAIPEIRGKYKEDVKKYLSEIRKEVSL